MESSAIGAAAVEASAGGEIGFCRMFSCFLLDVFVFSHEPDLRKGPRPSVSVSPDVSGVVVMDVVVSMMLSTSASSSVLDSSAVIGSEFKTNCECVTVQMVSSSSFRSYVGGLKTAQCRRQTLYVSATVKESTILSRAFR